MTRRKTGLSARMTAAGLLVAVILAMTSGCTQLFGGQGPGSSGASQLDLPKKNVEQWVLPLDEFLISDKQLKKLSYAGALLIEQCVQERSARYDVPYVDFDAAYGDESRVRATLVRTQAETFGYHSPAMYPPAGIEEWERFRTTTLDDAEAEAVDDCGREADDETPAYGARVLNFTSDFAVAAFQGAVASADVVQAAAAWQACMAPQGIEDLPADPTDMPSPSNTQKFDVSSDDNDPDRASITPAEIELALADVDCRESTGYQQTLYDALWTRETSLLEENQDAFAEVRESIEATDAEIDQVITEHATAGSDG